MIDYFVSVHTMLTKLHFYEIRHSCRHMYTLHHNIQAEIMFCV